MVLKSKNHMFHLVSSIVSIMFIHFLYASIGWSKDPINFQQLTPSPSAAPTVHPAVQFWGAATACDPSHRSWSRPPTSGREPGPLEIYEEIIGNLYRESTIESGFAWWPSNKYMIFHDIPISIPQFFLFLFPTRFPSSLDSPLLADIPLGQSKCADSANRGGVSRPK
jgi:hypothetical protein